MDNINHFGLENFRVFKGRTDFDFKPVTIFTGKNNSGKSTVIKAFKLLNNAITFNENIFTELDFQKYGDNLGNFNLAKTQGTIDNSFYIYLKSYEYENLYFKLKYSCGITDEKIVYQKEDELEKLIQERKYPVKAILEKVSIIKEDISIISFELTTSLASNNNGYIFAKNKKGFSYVISFHTEKINRLINNRKLEKNINVNKLIQGINKVFLNDTGTFAGEESSLGVYGTIDSLIDNFINIKGKFDELKVAESEDKRHERKEKVFYLLEGINI